MKIVDFGSYMNEWLLLLMGLCSRGGGAGGYKSTKCGVMRVTEDFIGAHEKFV